MVAIRRRVRHLVAQPRPLRFAHLEPHNLPGLARGVVRIGLGPPFLPIGISIVVRIVGRIAGIDRIQPVGDLPQVRHAVVVQIVGFPRFLRAPSAILHHHVVHQAPQAKSDPQRRNRRPRVVQQALRIGPAVRVLPPVQVHAHPSSRRVARQHHVVPCAQRQIASGNRLERLITAVPVVVGNGPARIHMQAELSICAALCQEGSSRRGVRHLHPERYRQVPRILQAVAARNLHVVRPVERPVRSPQVARRRRPAHRAPVVAIQRCVRHLVGCSRPRSLLHVQPKNLSRSAVHVDGRTVALVFLKICKTVSVRIFVVFGGQIAEIQQLPAIRQIVAVAAFDAVTKRQEYARCAVGEIQGVAHIGARCFPIIVGLISVGVAIGTNPVLSGQGQAGNAEDAGLLRCRAEIGGPIVGRRPHHHPDRSRLNSRILHLSRNGVAEGHGNLLRSRIGVSAGIPGLPCAGEHNRIQSAEGFGHGYGNCRSAIHCGHGRGSWQFAAHNRNVGRHAAEDGRLSVLDRDRVDAFRRISAGIFRPIGADNHHRVPPQAGPCVGDGGNKRYGNGTPIGYAHGGRRNGRNVFVAVHRRGWSAQDRGSRVVHGQDSRADHGIPARIHGHPFLGHNGGTRTGAGIGIGNGHVGGAIVGGRDIGSAGGELRAVDRCVVRHSMQNGRFRIHHGDALNGRRGVAASIRSRPGAHQILSTNSRANLGKCNLDVLVEVIRGGYGRRRGYRNMAFDIG